MSLQYYMRQTGVCMGTTWKNQIATFSIYGERNYSCRDTDGAIRRAYESAVMERLTPPEAGGLEVSLTPICTYVRLPDSWDLKATTAAYLRERMTPAYVDVDALEALRAGGADERLLRVAANVARPYEVALKQLYAGSCFSGDYWLSKTVLPEELVAVAAEVAAAINARARVAPASTAVRVRIIPHEPAAVAAAPAINEADLLSSESEGPEDEDAAEAQYMGFVQKWEELTNNMTPEQIYSKWKREVSRMSHGLKRRAFLWAGIPEPSNVEQKRMGHVLGGRWLPFDELVEVARAGWAERDIVPADVDRRVIARMLLRFQGQIETDRRLVDGARRTYYRYAPAAGVRQN